MNVERTANGQIVIEYSLDEAKPLVAAITEHAEDLPTAALDLASLLRQAQYEARNHFRQPPRPWETRPPLPQRLTPVPDHGGITMKIFRTHPKSVAIRSSLDEARHLLMGLEDARDALGEPGEALAKALRQAGVQPPDPQPIRTEYMPPLH